MDSRNKSVWCNTEPEPGVEVTTISGLHKTLAVYVS